jgi:hypothetical protein
MNEQALIEVLRRNPIDPADESAVRDALDAWADGDGGKLQPHEYLGWTWRDYQQWVDLSEFPFLHQGDNAMRWGLPG